MKLALQWLSSVWFGMILIAAIAASCVVGSVIYADERLGGDYAMAYVFGTPWFMGLALMLVLNLVLCSWRRSFEALRLWRRRSAVTERAFYEDSPNARAIPWNGSMEALAAALRRRYTVVYRAGDALHAQKGLLNRSGATVIHLGLIVIVAAGFYRMAADEMGWGIYGAQIAIPEGDATGVCHLRSDRLKPPEPGNMAPHRLPFTLRALDFRADYHPNSGVPRFYSSLVEVSDDRGPQIFEITMQRALNYRGFKITQNSFREEERLARPQFRVTDHAARQAVTVDTLPGDPVRLPFRHSNDLFLYVSGHDTGSTYTVANLATGAVLHSGAIVERAGASAPAAHQGAAFTVETLGIAPGHVTILGVTSDPSAPWLFAGCILVALGCCMAFMINYRQVWAWHDAEQGVVRLAMSSRGQNPRAQREYDSLVAELQALPPGTDKQAPTPAGAASA